MKAHTPAPAEIAARAYEIYLWRGATDGHALEDWLEAERELTGAGMAESEAPPADLETLLPDRRERVKTMKKTSGIPSGTRAKASLKSGLKSA